MSASVLIPIREPRFSVKADLVLRRRRIEAPLPRGFSGLPENTQRTGYDVRVADPAKVAEPWQWVTWLRLSPRLGLIEKYNLTGWSGQSSLQAGIDAGQAKNLQNSGITRFSLSWENRIDHSTTAGLQGTLRVGMHAGRLSETAALEDHFMLGAGPDARFQLRAHPLFQQGMLGTTPLARDFILGNLTVGHDLHSWKWLRLGLVAFCDAARMPHLYPGQNLSSTALDTGAGIEFGLLGLTAPRFTLTYGHDWKGHRNVFYLSTALR
jgi:hypothetical protein